MGERGGGIGKGPRAGIQTQAKRNLATCQNGTFQLEPEVETCFFVLFFEDEEEEEGRNV